MSELSQEDLFLLSSYTFLMAYKDQYFSKPPSKTEPTSKPPFLDIVMAMTATFAKHPRARQIMALYDTKVKGATTN